MGRYLIERGGLFLRLFDGTWTNERAEALIYDDERMQECFPEPQARPGWTLAVEDAERFGGTVISETGKREPGRSKLVRRTPPPEPITFAERDEWITRRLAREREQVAKAPKTSKKQPLPPLPNLGPTVVRPWSDLQRELAKLDAAEAEATKRRGR